MDLRKQTKQNLQRFISSEKIVNSVEKNIYEISNNETLYKDNLYNVLISLKQGMSVQNIITYLKSKKVGWNHPNFDEVAFKQKEQDDFTISPFQVEEGVLKCQKCGGCKTFSYSKQTRSADEPMTTFANCVACNHKWQYSG
jgi:DNA-directed RNA polymerase subunit M/transcription elongation factor TFIIS